MKNKTDEACSKDKEKDGQRPEEWPLVVSYHHVLCVHTDLGLCVYSVTFKVVGLYMSPYDGLESCPGCDPKRRRLGHKCWMDKWIDSLSN